MVLPLFPEYKRTLDWQFCDYWEQSGGEAKLKLGEEGNPEDHWDCLGSSSVGEYDYSPLDDFVDCETGLIRVNRTCPFCSAPLEGAIYENNSDDKVSNNSEHEGPIWLRSVLGCCPNCLHWEWCMEESVEGYPETTYAAAMISKLRTFPDLPSGASSELAQALRAKKVAWTALDPRNFELFIGDVLKANYVQCEVIHLGGTCDRGRDYYLIDAEKKQQYVVQVKCHEKDGPEGAPTIRSLLGAIVQDGRLNGIMISNAQRFTPEAHISVREAWLKSGIYVDLVDRGKLNRMLAPLMPEQPWRNYIAVIHPHLASYFGYEFSGTK